MFSYVYIDNVLLFKLDLNLVKLIKIKLNEHFKMIDLRSLSCYLSMRIIRSFNRINLNQLIFFIKDFKAIQDA